MIPRGADRERDEERCGALLRSLIAFQVLLALGHQLLQSRDIGRAQVSARELAPLGSGPQCRGARFRPVSQFFDYR